MNNTRAKKYLSLANVLLVGTTLTACATNPISPQAADRRYCEIIYAPIPHVTTAHIVGQEKLDKLFALSNDDQYRFFRSLSGITESLITATLDADGSWEQQPAEEIIGGYEGLSIPSLSIRFLSQQGGDITQLESAANALGYIYAQDSVWVQCPDDGIKNNTDSITVIAQDGPSRPFLDSDTAAILFGIMIALNNGSEGLGYSYYPRTGYFETSELSVEAQNIQNILGQASEFLMQISDGGISLDVSTEKVEVSFPHNSWSTARLGESYLSRLPEGVSRKVLAEHRERYLAAIDTFLVANNVE